MSLCVLTICFQSLFGSAIVLCTDIAGTTRLEWGCTRGGSESCQVADRQCASDDDGDGVHLSSAGCIDTPVGIDAVASLIPGQRKSDIARLAPVMLPWLVSRDLMPAGEVTRPATHHATSPPAMAFGRTIVFLI